MEALVQLVDPLVTLLALSVVFYVLKERSDRLELRMEAGFDRMATKAEVLPRLDRLERQMDAVRADLTQIALVVGAKLPERPTG